MVVVSVNIVVIGSMVLMFVMAISGVIPLPHSSSPSATFLSAGLIVTFIHVPLIYVGWKITQMKLWAIIVSALSGAIMAAVFFTFVFDLISSVDLIWHDISGFQVIYSTFSMLVTMQCLASIVAGLAWKERNRRLTVDDCVASDVSKFSG